MRLEEVYHKQQGIISLEQLAKELKIEGNIRDVFDKWLRSGHNQYFAVKDLTRNFYPGDEDHPNGWVEIKGKVMNRGKEGGFVFMKLITGRGKENYGCYIKPGEAKAFRSISTAEGLYYPSAVLNTGMAINRPNEFSFIYNELPYSGSKVENPAGWIDMDTSAFQPSHKEIIVDNLDPDFSYDDRANQTLFQKWFGVKRTGDLYTKNMEERFWNPLVCKNFYGKTKKTAMKRHWSLLSMELIKQYGQIRVNGCVLHGNMGRNFYTGRSKVPYGFYSPSNHQIGYSLGTFGGNRNNSYGHVTFGRHSAKLIDVINFNVINLRSDFGTIHIKCLLYIQPEITQTFIMK